MAMRLTAVLTEVGEVTSITAAATAVDLSALDKTRLGMSLYNDCADAVFVRLGAGDASSTAFTVKLAGYGYYEVPAGFCGPLSAIWDAASPSGAMRVTRYV